MVFSYEVDQALDLFFGITTRCFQFLTQIVELFVAIVASRSTFFQFLDELFPVVCILWKTHKDVGYLRRDARNWSACDLSIDRYMLSILEVDTRLPLWAQQQNYDESFSPFALPVRAFVPRAQALEERYCYLWSLRHPNASLLRMARLKWFGWGKECDVHKNFTSVICSFIKQNLWEKKKTSVDILFLY